MGPSTSLPPYLTSGASSRAHHALLVGLNDAITVQEEIAVLSKEIRRVKEVLGVKGQSTGKIAETLIILLHCLMVTHEPVNVEWALVSALQLAEGGSNIRERRMGYLYLTERLPIGHELGLMLINTIRKDLTSTSPHDTLLALHAIIKIPSHDLSPAVTPLLIGKPLIRHPLPAIRQATVQALIALHLHSPEDMSRTLSPKTFPLSMNRIIKLLSQEIDACVAAVYLSLIRTLIDLGVCLIQSNEQREFLVEQVLAQSKRADGNGQMQLEVLRALNQVLKGSNESLPPAVGTWMTGRLKQIKQCRGWNGAFLLDSCYFTSLRPDNAPPTTTQCVSLVSRLLVPSTSNSTIPVIPRPNDHVLALKCLAHLTPSAWDSVFGQSEMAAIMEGINNVDDTIRKLTLRLLSQLSPELLSSAMSNHLESIRTSTNLCLPLTTGELSMTEKLRVGREETALRALGVAEIRIEKAKDDGSAYGNMVVDVLSVLAGVKEGDQGSIKYVWEVGLKKIVEVLNGGSSTFKQGFVDAIFGDEVRMVDPTLAVLRATSCEYALFGNISDTAVQVLLDGIEQYGSPVQELILVAAIGVILRTEKENRNHLISVVHQTMEDIRNSAGRYIQTRCKQIMAVLGNDLLDELQVKAKSQSLPDLLEAIIATYKTIPIPSAKSPSPSSSSLSPNTTSNRISPTALRYDAYEPPRNTASRPPKASPRMTDRFNSGRTHVRGNESMSAGEFALFFQEDEQSEDAVSLELGQGMDNLGLSFERSPHPRSPSSDPLITDPTTPRLR